MTPVFDFHLEFTHGFFEFFDFAACPAPLILLSCLSKLASCRWDGAAAAAGTGSGDPRERWLAAVLRGDAAILTADQHDLSDAARLVPGYRMRFAPCA